MDEKKSVCARYKKESTENALEPVPTLSILNLEVDFIDTVFHPRYERRLQLNESKSHLIPCGIPATKQGSL